MHDLIDARGALRGGSRFDPPGPKARRMGSLRAVLTAAVLGVPVAGFLAGGPDVMAQQAPASPAPDDDAQRSLLRRDIATLRRNLRELGGAEQGVLGELKELEAEVLRRQGDLVLAGEKLAETERRASDLAARIEALDARLGTVRAEVASRIAALYRMGRPRYLRVVLASDDPRRLLGAYRAASALAERDARLADRYRSERSLAQSEAEQLASLQPVLASDRLAHEEAARQAEAAFENKQARLRSIQGDRRMKQAALAELEAAERSLGTVIEGMPGSAGPALGFDRFRGLLDWPAHGAVSTPFGRGAVRGTDASVPHQGIDIEAPFGAGIRAVFEGNVVFAQWLRGFGLTVIVDHGEGSMSVYAHASVILVQKGDRVARGQKIALVGDSGSIRGPYLYFELRQNGRPVDPTGWLRPR